MNAETFLDNFRRLAEAPGGVLKLREMVLQLAVQGRLVAQDVNDEPAAKLLTRIAATKKRLQISGGIPKPRNTEPITEIPHPVPETWEWSRLGDISLFIEAGWSPKCESRPRRDSEWGVLKISAVTWNVFNPDENKALPRSAEPRKKFEVNSGDFVMSRANTAELVAKSVVIESTPPRLLLNDKLLRVRFPDDVDPRFVNIFNNSPTARTYYEGVASGTSVSMRNVSRDNVCNLAIPLPPLAEQHRIVAKVDELMALCDELEARQQERRTVHVHLNAAALDRLTSAAADSDFTAAWTRVRSNFELLYSVPENVTALRQAILQLAVQGKLVEQDSDAEPAQVSMNRVKTFFEQLAAEKTIKKPKPLPEISESEYPYELPMGWAWCRLGEIVRISSGDGLTAKNMKEGKVPVYGGNGVTGYHDAANVEKPTLVVGRVGFYCGSVHITPQSAWVTDNAFITTFAETETDLDFLYWLLKATDLRENDSATAQPVISGRKVYPIILGIPPRAEQKRIVKRVHQLMALCDELETKLTQQQNDADRLTEAMVAAILDGAAA